ncbi:MAG: hypothetical protein ACFFC7_32170 [Candidatus Hermodarchaeota archaeon]
MSDDLDELRDQLYSLRDEWRSIQQKIASLDPSNEEEEQELERLEDERDRIKREMHRIERKLRRARKETWRRYHREARERAYERMGSYSMGWLEDFLEGLGESLGSTMEGVAEHIEDVLEDIPFVPPIPRIKYTYRPGRYRRRRERISIPPEHLEEFAETSAQKFQKLSDKLGLKLLVLLNKRPMALDELKEALETDTPQLNSLLETYDKEGFIVHEVVQNRYLITTSGYRALALAYMLFRKLKQEVFEMEDEDSDRPTRKGLQIKIEDEEESEKEEA